MAKLHFLYSVMNAGKTTHLLQVHHNYIENGGNVLLFTSSIDDRFGVGKIKSRIGIEADAISLKRSDAIDRIVAAEHAERPLTAVLIDEVQFMTPEQVRQLVWIVDEGRINRPRVFRLVWAISHPPPYITPSRIWSRSARRRDGFS